MRWRQILAMPGLRLCGRRRHRAKECVTMYRTFFFYERGLKPRRGLEGAQKSPKDFTGARKRSLRRVGSRPDDLRKCDFVREMFSKIRKITKFFLGGPKISLESSVGDVRVCGKFSEIWFRGKSPPKYWVVAENPGKTADFFFFWLIARAAAIFEWNTRISRTGGVRCRKIGIAFLGGGSVRALRYERDGRYWCGVVRSRTNRSQCWAANRKDVIV